jgi:hypothetical protein
MPVGVTQINPSSVISARAGGAVSAPGAGNADAKLAALKSANTN